jgi:hypothetical protein
MEERMTPYARLRCAAFLTLALLSWTGAAQAQFPLALEQKVVEAGPVMTFTVTSNGAVDLSDISNKDLSNPRISFRDSALEAGQQDDIQISIRTSVATARKLTVNAFMREPERVSGPIFRQMHLFFDGVRVSLNYTLAPAFVCPADCKAPKKCIDRKCVLPPTSCKPRCQEPRFLCNEQKKRCELAQ